MGEGNGLISMEELNFRDVVKETTAAYVLTKALEPHNLILKYFSGSRDGNLGDMVEEHIKEFKEQFGSFGNFKEGIPSFMNYYDKLMGIINTKYPRLDLCLQ